MPTLALFGAGRIGAIHARNAVALRGVQLRYIVDVDVAAARRLARQVGAKVTEERAALADPAIDAVIIASSTDTHARLAIAAARAGKAIFCEKPIDLSLARVDACIRAVLAARVPMQVGFNRRFDPTFAALRARLGAGEIGLPEQVIITSRDPAPPPIAYVKVSGGLFRDMTIHDLDMARWLLGEEPVSVFATGSCLVDAAIGRAGDIDTAVVTLRTASGRIAVITNSRRAAYGYDQRIEVLGAKGRLSAGNRHATAVESASARGITRDKPLHFFLERYADAYRIELHAFIDAIGARRSPDPGPDDGRRALLLAEAALRSMASGRVVRLR